ncbi:hypothetical protein EV702DRAFT_1204576 [Suillus placidus]|uniref:GCN1-like HEAT repeats domain-containing protein n=1 Tax=Suillus placidus TaxID=48579 RepID=A0A9P6ZIQ8_9AGAM|nr:hypothetical protein EV702DRAFT_1204576 [Suillus placidus]
MVAERTSSSTSNGEKEHLDDSINNSVWHDTTFFGSQREGRMASPRDTEDGQTVQYVDRDEAQTPEVAQYMLSSQTPSTSNFETPLCDLAKCCSARLDSFHEWVGVATLRSLGISSVPEELQVEQFSSLVLRVLHRLRALSEQTPFDAATFYYAFPLLMQVLLTDVSDAAFSGKATMESERLLNVTRDEVGVLTDGTLLQEVYDRNACLQAIRPFDLTDLDWSPQLWVACHADDEQNARLANHAWEDNSLMCQKTFLTSS